MDNTLAHLVRIGTVSAVDDTNRTARVRFHDQSLTSAWLHVLKSPPFIPTKDVTQETEATGGGSGDASFETHKHEVVISPWMPDIDDVVVCLYMPVFNGDGYILGAV